MKVITTRIEDGYFEDLKSIEKEEHTERAEVVRKLLATGISEWKTKRALELLKAHKITIRTAAAMASVPYFAMMDLAAKAEIDSGYTLQQLQKDLKR